jgi:hypothetical protein
MHLFLVKSDIIKCIYFFEDENKAYALFNELKDENEDVIIKHLKTSDEWSVEQLVKHFKQSKELL